MPVYISKIFTTINCVIVDNAIYYILRGRVKGFNSSITTILFEVSSYRTVVG